MVLREGVHLPGAALPRRTHDGWAGQGIQGELADAAASILMKILCGARMGRWDLLKAVTSDVPYQMDDVL